MAVQTARSAALAALMRCENSGYANLVVADVLKKSGLSARDRAFAARLVYGTVERRLTLEARLAPYLRQPLSTMPAVLRCILRSGLYQAVYMESVPVSAAVNESVALAKASGKGSAAGFVNAVLRKAATEPFAPVFESEEQRLSVTYSVGLPVVRLLLAAYPERAEGILAAADRPAALTVCTNPLKTTPEALTCQLAEQQVTVTPLSVPGMLALENAGDVSALAAFRQGLFHVQGLASRLAVEALEVRPGQTVLDLCAAPGGKSASIAGLLAGAGSLYACELHQNRVPLIRQLLDRLGVQNAVCLQNDAATPNARLPVADRVLCDVPCSGLGTLAKKPDIRYKDLSGMPTLIETQSRILQTAAGYLAPGGRLVYATCTVNPDENQGVVGSFLQKNPAFVETTPDLSRFGGEKVSAGTLFLPDRAQTDGFYIACLEKNTRNP